VETRTDDLRARVREVLAEVFPDKNVDVIGDDDGLASVFDLDSLAAVDLALEIERRTGCYVPDEDLAKLTSIAATAEYLAAHPRTAR
jgi:acyl carrier protein